MLLLHACCGPCLLGSYPLIKQQIGAEQAALFWFNPNIHPFVEYNNRLNSFKLAANSLGLKYFFGADKAEYGLNTFLTACIEEAQKNNSIKTPFESPQRCYLCYKTRFRAAAEYADEHGFEALTTTLTVSPYQKHDLIQKAFAELKETYHFKTNFIYYDLTKGYADTRTKSIELGIYRQKYCGCVFSEEERYKSKKKYQNPSETKAIPHSEFSGVQNAKPLK